MTPPACVILKWSNSNSLFYPILLPYSLTFFFPIPSYLVMEVMNPLYDTGGGQTVPFLLWSLDIQNFYASFHLHSLSFLFPFFSQWYRLPPKLPSTFCFLLYLPPYRWWWRPPVGWCWSGQTAPGCRPHWERSGAVCQSSLPLMSLWPPAALSYWAASGSRDTPPQSRL